MKILAIRGKNLASLEGEFNIDFREEPLKSAGLFAITGATGAGKSTILDAICLALFNQTPRSVNADGKIQIEDTNSNLVKQDDCRNILRRGTGEGYAEVEFVALDGNRYKSTWIVRRSNNKATGTLQDETVRLFNITTGEEYPEKKKNTLIRITELIGLNFYQFTRTVLLAQGDFAAFLKANQKDKAELLEKLTGTDIYSKISQNIFTRTKDAEGEYNNIFEKIKGIEILSEDTISALNEERTIKNNQKEETEVSLRSLEKNVEWIRRDTELKKGILEATELVEVSKNKIETAKPRYDFIALYDKMQNIREVFFTKDKDERTLNRDLESLAQKETLLENANKELDNLKVCIEEIIVKRNNTRKFQESLKEEIDKARELDINIANEQKNRNTLLSDINSQISQKDSLSKEIENKENILSDFNIQIKAYEKWFEEKMYLSEIVPKIDLIISYLEEAHKTKEQILVKSEEKTAITNLQKSNNETLNKLNQIAEELNQTLSSEIIVLRKKLKDGEPCPVCGSKEHFLTSLAQDKHIQEAELSKQKDNTKKQIEHYTKLIEQQNRDIAAIDSLINTHKKTYEESVSRADIYLKVIPNWKALFEENRLISSLKQLIKLWNEKTLSREKAINDQSILVPQINLQKENLQKGIIQIANLQKSYDSINALIEKLTSLRKNMLGGRTVDETERKIKDEIAIAEKQYTDATNNLNRSTEYCSKIKGETENIRKNNIELRDSIEKNDTIIKQWCKENSLDEKQVAGIITRNIEEIRCEKEILSGFKDSLIKNMATLDERKDIYSKHQELEYKCDSNLLEELNATISEQREIVRINAERVSRINFELETNKLNIEKTAKYNKELEKKKEVYLNWERLNKMFGSKDGVKFKTIAQGYTLDALLNYANIHLKELSDRYILQKVPNSLGVQVVDKDMMNEIRSVHSLSGGESFLLSLSLALGLSSLSSNRMNVESLFIDEGFGSLDIDTLRVAMDSLGRLQNQGKKIGVISHVSEMSDQIRTQIKVMKAHNGKSRIEIIG